MQTIYLDISNKGVVPTVYAKQNDVGRKFAVILTDSGLPYIPVSGSAFSVWYKGASGEGNYTDIGDKPAFSLSENKVEVEMIAQMLSAHGDGILCLTLNSPDGNQISSWNIPYMCEIVPGSESEKAEEYYTAFSKAVEKLQYPDETLSVSGKAADAAATGLALSKKAPAGYGLGGETKDIGTDDVSTIRGTGWYWGYIGMPDGFGPSLIHHIERNENYATQLVYTLADVSYWGSVCIRREKSAGEWQPWEWENPPMELGVEYRTTERIYYNGVQSPVYTMELNCGGLPASCYDVYPFPDEVNNAFAIIEWSGFITFWGIALPDTGGDFKVRPAKGRNGVVKETNVDRSEGGEVYIKLKYIKAT